MIASNREESAEETVGWYNQRGETSENRLKELKLGVGMERITVGLTRSELARIEAIAKEAGLTTSQLLMRYWREGKNEQGL